MSTHLLSCPLQEREEAGSPDLLGEARLGLAMRVQQQLCAAGMEVGTAFSTSAVFNFSKRQS